MDKYTRLNAINNMMGKKHKFTLQFNETTKALICECDTEQMHHVISELYAARDTSEEFVKKSIAGVNKETVRVIGFGISRD